MTQHAFIGFVGLGNMGRPMALRLIRAGYALKVFDLDNAAMAEAAAEGATKAKSAIDCAKEVDLFLTALPRPATVETVMAGADGALAAMRSGATWVDFTTNHPELVTRLAKSAPRGISVLDCPVTGAVDGARNGTLTLFLGGDAAAKRSVGRVLEHLGLIMDCGPLGSGMVVKLVTNQLWFISAAAIGEGFATGLANGVDLRVLWDAIQKSVGDSFVARHDAPSIFAGHFDPSFSLALCLKDLDLVSQLNREIRAELPMTAAARHAFEMATMRYGGDAGQLHAAKRIEDDTGLSMRLDGDWTPPWER